MTHVSDALRRAWIVAAVCLAAAAAAPIAAARTLVVTTDPPVTAADDETVRVTVSGSAATACGASAVRLQPPVSSPSPPPLIDLEVREDCAIPGPPLPEPFAVSSTLGPFAPGVYVLSVRDTDGRVVSVAITVHGVGPTIVEPLAPPTAGEPVTLLLRSFGCGPGTAEVQGTMVTVRLSSSCEAILGGRHLFEWQIALGELPVGDYTVRVVDGGGSLGRTAFSVAPAGSCVPAETTLCLHGRRFGVTAAWRDPTGRTGVARAIAPKGNDGSGLLWFFDRSNVELTVKLLDGCGLNGRWWVFLASGSTVEYEVTVRDTRSDLVRRYSNAQGTLAPLVTDVEAFELCDG